MYSNKSGNEDALAPTGRWLSMSAFTIYEPSLPRQRVTSQHEQVGAQNRSPGVGLERFEAVPITAVESEAAFQERNVSLDPCAKPTELFIHPAALDHLGDLQATLLVKHDVFDARLLGCLAICLRGKATIEGRLPRNSTEYILLSFDRLLDQCRVRRISVEDETVEDHPALASREAELVTEIRLPPLLLDDVSVGLEDGDELLGSWYGFVPEDTTLGLVHDLSTERDVVLEVENQRKSQQYIHFVHKGRWIVEAGYGAERIGDGLLGERYQTPVDFGPLLIVLGVLDLEHALLGGPSVIDELDVVANRASLFHQTSEHTHDVEEQCRIGGLVDVCLFDGAVGPNRTTPFDSSEFRFLDEQDVDGFQGLGTKFLEIALERVAIEALVVSDAAKAPVAIRVDNVEAELGVAVAVHLLDDDGTDNLFRGHSFAAFTWIDVPRDQISMDQAGDLGASVEDAAHLRQLGSMRMFDGNRDKFLLFLYCTSHRRPVFSWVCWNTLRENRFVDSFISQKRSMAYFFDAGTISVFAVFFATYLRSFL